MHVYAIEIAKSSIPLITLLNDGVEPKWPTTRGQFYVIEVEEDGSPGYAKIMTKREVFKAYDIHGHTPYMLRLKPVK